MASTHSVFLLDNYDSFTYNLYDYLCRLGAQVRVCRNDECTIDHIRDFRPQGIVLSPGPKRPADAGIMPELIAELHAEIPMFGICLGYQAIGEFFGARLNKAAQPMHGKTSLISHNGEAMFRDLPHQLEVMRYHSLVLEDFEDTPLRVCAETSAREAMAFYHNHLLMWGVQFHPESIMTQEGITMLKNWLDILK